MATSTDRVALPGAAQVLGEITNHVDYVRVTVGDESSTDGPMAAREGWIPAATLTRDADVLYQTMREAMDGRGIAEPTSDPATTLAALHRHVIDDHLAVMVDTARRACRVGARMLWANIGSSCASSFGAFMGPLPERREEIRTRTAEFFAAGRPELRASGAVEPIGPTWAWQRNACCLWYQHDDNDKCGDCSLHDTAARQARHARILAETPA